MSKLRVGYFKSFGTKEVEAAKTSFEEKHPDVQVTLKPLYQDQVKYEFEDNNIDFALTDPRDNEWEQLKVVPISQVSLMVLLQAGNFMPGEQTVEKNQLSKVPNILIAKPDEEAGELHYHRDLLRIKSPFLAVDSFNEAALMAESGSGYFLMNERTANVIESEQLQKLFLLDDGKQLKQRYVGIFKEASALINDFYQELKKQF